MSLRAAFLASVRDGSTLKSMQNKSMSAEVYYNPGGLMLGDAFNMRHPLTGGGMTVALHDSKLLCDMLQTLDNFEVSQPAKMATMTTRMRCFFLALKLTAPFSGWLRDSKGDVCLPHATQALGCDHQHTGERAVQGLLPHGREVERRDAERLLRLPQPGRHLLDRTHLAAVWPQPEAIRS